MDYDVIVIGVGSMGSAACYQLARRGVRVLGLEQFEVSHEKGSHTGQSRLIRKAYFEHSNYVPLLQRAYKLWSGIEKESGVQLFHRTGIAYFGPAGEELLTGVKKSASIYGLPVDQYKHKDINERWPQFSLPANYEGIFEPDAGFIAPELAIRTIADLALKEGAEIITDTQVLSWTVNNNEVEVHTSRQTYKAGKLIITAGAYSKPLLPDFKPNLKVTRQLLAWVEPENRNDFTLRNFPCWVLKNDNGEGIYYGFPILPEDQFSEPYGLKIAYHRPGVVINPEEIADFDSSEEEEILRSIIARYLPGAMKEVITFKSCLYTYSDDDHFIIDNLPGFEKQVMIACGFSGHGFKFVPVVGEILADMIIDSKTSQPIEFLSIKRFD